MGVSTGKNWSGRVSRLGRAGVSLKLSCRSVSYCRRLSGCSQDFFGRLDCSRGFLCSRGPIGPPFYLPANTTRNIQPPKR